MSLTSMYEGVASMREGIMIVRREARTGPCVSIPRMTGLSGRESKWGFTICVVMKSSILSPTVVHFLTYFRRCYLMPGQFFGWRLVPECAP